MGAETFFDGVVDAVKNKSPLRRQTALGKAGGPGSQHDCERIVFADLNIRLVVALTVEQAAVAQIGRQRNRFDRTQIL